MDHNEEFVFEINKLILNSGGSIYKLVNMAVRRALEVAEGAPKLVPDVLGNSKPTTIALQEIAEGKVKYLKDDVKK